MSSLLLVDLSYHEVSFPSLSISCKSLLATNCLGLCISLYLFHLYFWRTVLLNTELFIDSFFFLSAPVYVTPSVSEKAVINHTDAPLYETSNFPLDFLDFVLSFYRLTMLFLGTGPSYLSNWSLMNFWMYSFSSNLENFQIWKIFQKAIFCTFLSLHLGVPAQTCCMLDVFPKSLRLWSLFLHWFFRLNHISWSL